MSVLHGLLLPMLVPAMLAAAPAAALSYKLIELRPLPGHERGAMGDTSYGLNEWGQSVGRSAGGPGGDRAVIWDKAGNPTELATPEGTWWSKADAINDHGVAVGDIGIGEISNDTKRAARWTSPAAYDFFLEDNGFASFADVVNNNGWIGGIRYTAAVDDMSLETYVWSPDGTTRWIAGTVETARVEWYGVNDSNVFSGFQFDISGDPSAYWAVIWSEATGLVVLPDSGLYYTAAGFINEDGWVTGAQFDGEIADIPMLWDPEQNLTLLDILPGMTGSIPNQINTHRRIVGWSHDAWNCDGFGDVTCRRATMWAPDGTVSDLNDLIDPSLGITLLWANAVNDRGWINGIAMKDGQTFAFLLTTVPEPATWATMLTGFAISGAALRRRRRALGY